jgi:hypothetical protein
VVIVGPKLGEKVLVVGVTGSTKPGQKEGNFFSNKFKKASKGIGAQHEASGFESNVIKMPHLDVQQFMDELITDIG